MSDNEFLAEGVTRKHFQLVADTLKEVENKDKRRELAEHHAKVFAAANERFDKGKFFKAAGLELNEETITEGTKYRDPYRDFLKRIATSYRKPE